MSMNHPSGFGGFANIFMGTWNKPRGQAQKVAIKVLRTHGVNEVDENHNERVEKVSQFGVSYNAIISHLLGRCSEQRFASGKGSTIEILSNS